MNDIPHAVLSDRLGELLSGHRILSGLFTTFNFEPGFFEQQILPAIFDIPFSEDPIVRLAQMEDAIRDIPLEVYYDPRGLNSEGGMQARLDIRRIAVRHKPGYVFHPKNILLLIEEDDPEPDTQPARKLLVGSMSANLTRAGWWENVEACHFEVIEEGESNRLKGDLREYLNRLKPYSDRQGESMVLKDILGFLRTSDERGTRSDRGHLLTHFYSGTGSLVSFLKDTAGNRLYNTYLEILSPFLDEGFDKSALKGLLEEFNPKEVRVYLPQDRQGAAQCTELYSRALLDQSAVTWGVLPDTLKSMGAGDKSAVRTLHAKVYRFFTQNPKTEIVFVGSANLTHAAHMQGGNWETGFLVELEPTQRPDFWLKSLAKPPKVFAPVPEENEGRDDAIIPLDLRYDWLEGKTYAYWDHEGASGPFDLKMAGTLLGKVNTLKSRDWVEMDNIISNGISERLKGTSLVQVVMKDGRSGYVLMMESGMAKKPSLLMDLNPQQILKFWSLLTPDQKARFIEQRALALGLGMAEGDHLREVLPVSDDSMFARFAGIFHAFRCMEKRVLESLTKSNGKDAFERLFGCKRDSLPSLLAKMAEQDAVCDPVNDYVTLLCACQLLETLRSVEPEFIKKNKEQVRILEGLLGRSEILRIRLIAESGVDAGKFMDWFDKWFLKRAEPKEGEE